MEQAAASGLTTLFAQLGVGGLMLAIIICGALWYLKVSKDVRDEKRGVIANLEQKLEAKDQKIDELVRERNEIQKQLLDCQFPDRAGVVSDDRP